jgi:hypothetical protein
MAATRPGVLVIDSSPPFSSQHELPGFPGKLRSTRNPDASPGEMDHSRTLKRCATRYSIHRKLTDFRQLVPVTNPIVRSRKGQAARIHRFPRSQEGV